MEEEMGRRKDLSVKKYKTVSNCLLKPSTKPRHIAVEGKM
jgi:hypothetical protein